jgi:hypothetical protein
MDKNTILIIFAVVVVPLGGLLAYQWWKLLNSPSGERYQKWRAQGPFTPLSRDDIAQDEASKERQPPARRL